MNNAHFTLYSDPDHGHSRIKAEVDGDDSATIEISRHGIDLRIFLDLKETRTLRDQLDVILADPEEEATSREIRLRAKDLMDRFDRLQAEMRRSLERGEDTP